MHAKVKFILSQDLNVDYEFFCYIHENVVVKEEINSSEHSTEGENQVEIKENDANQVSYRWNKADRPHREGWGDEDLFRTIVEVLQRVAVVAWQAELVVTAWWALIKELRKYRATEFKGLKGVDPFSAEIWLELTKWVLQ